MESGPEGLLLRVSSAAAAGKVGWAGQALSSEAEGLSPGDTRFLGAAFLCLTCTFVGELRGDVWVRGCKFKWK